MGGGGRVLGRGGGGQGEEMVAIRKGRQVDS